MIVLIYLPGLDLDSFGNSHQLCLIWVRLFKITGTKFSSEIFFSLDFQEQQMFLSQVAIFQQFDNVYN